MELADENVGEEWDAVPDEAALAMISVTLSGLRRVRRGGRRRLFVGRLSRPIGGSRRDLEKAGRGLVCGAVVML